MYQVQFKLHEHSGGSKHYQFVLITDQAADRALALFRWYGGTAGSGDFVGPSNVRSITSAFDKKVKTKEGRGYVKREEERVSGLTSDQVEKLLRKETKVFEHGANLSTFYTFMGGPGDEVDLDEPDPALVARQREIEAAEAAEEAKRQAELADNPDWGMF